MTLIDERMLQSTTVNTTVQPLIPFLTELNVLIKLSMHFFLSNHPYNLNFYEKTLCFRKLLLPAALLRGPSIYVREKVD